MKRWSRARKQAEADARAKAAAEATKKSEPTVLAKRCQGNTRHRRSLLRSTQPQQASNLVPEGSTAPVFPRC